MTLKFNVQSDFFIRPFKINSAFFSKKNERARQKINKMKNKKIEEKKHRHFYERMHYFTYLAEFLFEDGIFFSK